MNSSEIRQKFLDYFASKGHTIVPSSSLVPGNDPTLLFTNSGMVQFKDCFLGHDKRAYTRATSSQRCVRAGGKHNDLENVGYTSRHHTFFEMLGNFSFGDYFKRDAIKYAWELLTEVYKLPADKLWVTVYAEDDEAYGIWANEIGIPTERIVRIGDNKGARYASDNFWQMAETGPCGPCSEIFYDHGPDVWGGPPGTPDADGDRYIEIWNNVFMQFNRDAQGVLHPLPKPSVDTGMGLERIAAVLQHVHSNYDIDLFQNLVGAAARVTKTNDLTNNSLKVIADHIRACSFLIVDGVIPGNEGRGYVLRRIIRRAIRHGYKLGCRAAFFHKLVAALVAEMGAAYPELAQAQMRVTQVLRAEEERFFETIENGMTILERAIDWRNPVTQWLESTTKRRWSGLASIINYIQFDSVAFDLDAGGKREACLYVREDDDVELIVSYVTDTLSRLIQNKETGQGSIFKVHSLKIIVVEGNSRVVRDRLTNLLAANKENYPLAGIISVKDSELKGFRILDGELAFKLHDTFGFPLDLSQDICREHGWIVDEEGFNASMARQRDQARAAGKFKMAAGLAYVGEKTQFQGYDKLATQGKVVALYKDGTAVQKLVAPDMGVVVLDSTPFYAESGGQAGDVGVLMLNRAIFFAVEDTQKIQPEVFGHQGQVKSGSIQVGNVVEAVVDEAARAHTMRNHSATHLMHKALREVLGDHVQQKGSLVDADKTRFDFVHKQPMTDAEIRKVENIVNAEILANAECKAEVMAIEDAQKSGAMMLFGEKYGDEVRVLSIGSSKELCGGTHVKRTGDIGLFKIVAESGVAAGIRRVEAITGVGALDWVQQLDAHMHAAAAVLKAQPQEMIQRIAQVQDQVRSLEKELSALKSKLASSQGDELVNQAVDINGVKVLAALLEGADSKTLRETLDKLKDKFKSAVIVLSVIADGRVTLIAGVTADMTVKVKAGDLVNFVALQVGGKGGGRADMAQAGGTQPEHLAAALASVPGWVRNKL